jgi:hypothetical protein
MLFMKANLSKYLSKFGVRPVDERLPIVLDDTQNVTSRPDGSLQ